MNSRSINCAERPFHAYPIFHITIQYSLLLNFPSNRLYLAKLILQYSFSTSIFTAHQSPNQETPTIYNPSNIRTPHIQSLSSLPYDRAQISALSPHEYFINPSSRTPHSTCLQFGYTTSHLSPSQPISQTHSVNPKISP